MKVLRITITAPDRDNAGRVRPFSHQLFPLPQSYVEYARQTIVSRFMGATAAPATGYWRDYKPEPVTVYAMDVPADEAPKWILRAVTAAGMIGARAGQESVYVTAGDRSALVEPLEFEASMEGRAQAIAALIPPTGGIGRVIAEQERRAA